MNKILLQFAAIMLLLCSSLPAAADPGNGYAETVRLVEEAQKVFTRHFDSELIAEDRSILGLSSEGTSITLFTLGGKPVVVTMGHYGCSGSSLHTYYLLENGQVYVDALETYYATMNFSAQSRFDPYRHEYGGYLVTEQGIFRLSPDLSALVPSRARFYTWEECLRYFEEAEPDNPSLTEPVK